ncbi:MAG: SDR family NAD(P)-dependent oxidoreductase, partial [Candidatus Eremiobacteraeota bacterium]|nr:SDR family NAD(P)-dependent oxidoreductase [Candidatus Eremiobacteraeota bacterium]
MTDSLFDLHGKVAIVTGSTRGIGLAIATRLAQHGARVVISSRDPEACARVADELNADGERAIGVAAHVGKKDDLEHLVART